MSLITPEYQALQEQFHVQRPDYGCSSSRHVDTILAISRKLGGTRDILDYGAGKCHLQKGLPFPIRNYDPCISELAKRPAPADIVVCTDVLEHVEPPCLFEVLDDLTGLAKQVLFLTVATRPASKFLPDGRNAHLIQEPARWWLSLLLERMEMVSYQLGQGEFTAVFVPYQKEPAP